MIKIYLCAILITLPLFSLNPIFTIDKKVNSIELNIKKHYYSIKNIEVGEEDSGKSIKVYYDDAYNIKNISIYSSSGTYLQQYAKYYYNNKKIIYSYIQTIYDYGNCNIKIKNYFKNNKKIKRVIINKDKCPLKLLYPDLIKDYKELLEY